MRKIGSRRARNWTLATILWVSSWQPGLYAQQPAKLSPKLIAVLNEPTLELKDDDAPLLRLKKERFNAALNEGKARLDLYSRGLTPIPDPIEIGAKLFSAEADLYDKPEEKVEELQRQLDVYTEAEASLEKKVIGLCSNPRVLAASSRVLTNIHVISDPERLMPTPELERLEPSF